MINRSNILSFSMCLSLLSYFVYNFIYKDIYFTEYKNLWNSIYYIGTGQAFVSLALIRDSYSTKVNKRFLKVFAGLQCLFILNRLCLIFIKRYALWYYYGENDFLLGFVECVLILLSILLITNGRLDKR